MKVASSMQKDVVTVDETAAVAAAARLMGERHVGMLPVLADGHLVGVLTDRDIVLRVVATDRDPADLSVSEIMTGQPVRCHLDDSLPDVLRLMRIHQIHRVPVVSEVGQLLGIVSMTDIASVATVELDDVVATLSDLRYDALKAT